jgi:mitotic spindle assembly checkpoint protein MAD2
MWLLKGEVRQLVLVVNGVASGITLERWVFLVEHTSDKENSSAEEEKPSKSKKEISSEIAALLRQITATVTFLPMLDEQCAFDILIYTDRDTAVPIQWEESNPHLVKNAAEVRLRSFDTKIHRVEAAVAYREFEDGDV